MEDTDPQPELSQPDLADDEMAEPDFDRLIGVVTDGFVGAVGGLVGTAVLTAVLLVASTLGAFSLDAFSTLAIITGATLLLPSDAAAGYFVFLVNGMVTWPLFLASIGSYLPGDRFALKGLSFGVVLWSGFAVVFYEDYAGLALALYLGLTLVGHLAYGFALGAVYDYLSSRPGTLV